MKFSILTFVMSLTLISRTAFSDTYKCQSNYGDGADANVDVTIGNETRVRLPYTNEFDGTVLARVVTIKNLDRQPNNLPIQVFGLGLLENGVAHLVLMNDDGINIGTITTGVNGPNTMFMNLFQRIAGDWLRCARTP